MSKQTFKRKGKLEDALCTRSHPPISENMETAYSPYVKLCFAQRSPFTSQGQTKRFKEQETIKEPLQSKNRKTPSKQPLSCQAQPGLHSQVATLDCQRMVPSLCTLPQPLVKIVSIPLKEKGVGAGCLTQPLGHLIGIWSVVYPNRCIATHKTGHVELKS